MTNKKTLYKIVDCIKNFYPENSKNWTKIIYEDCTEIRLQGSFTRSIKGQKHKITIEKLEGAKDE